MSLNVSNVQLAVSPARFEGTIYRTYLLLNGTVAASVACIPTLPDHRIAFNKLLECLQRQEQQYPVAHKHQHITTSIICDLLETQLLIRIWFKDDILSKAETTEQFRRLIQVAKALEHLHLHKIVHGHLHPGNIFITARGDATIADVSINMFARAFTSQEFRIPLEPSSVYQAPEALDPRQMDLRPSSDVYAFASIVYAVRVNDPDIYILTPVQVMTGHSPRDASSIQSIRDSIEEISLFGNSHILKPTVIADNLWQVLSRCWSYDPEDRPTMKDIVFELEDIFLYM